MATYPRRIILSRTDNIGDVVLTLPMAGIIKRRYPDCEVIFLAQRYLEPVLEACPSVDRVLDWTALGEQAPGSVAEALAETAADAIIHVFPDRSIAHAARRAAIPLRIGTKRRWYHRLTCNRLVPLSRKHSDRHEAELNVQLLAPLEAIETDYHLPDLVEFLTLLPEDGARRRVDEFLNSAQFKLVLHPGSRGNGKEWPERHYLDLVDRLKSTDYQALVTGTADEGHRFARLADHPLTVDLTGKLGLAELVALLAAVDGVVASGTGPLHMAAATGTPTLGLFPTKAGPIGADRWGPLGRRAQFLTFQDAEHSCAEGRTCSCMAGIGVERVAEVVERWMAVGN
ncbi:MAG: glycosyltransferase family 9 protein [Gemmatimonadetes bacterium]|nr:glycosyltransferase family 9 protein [Gemmatimonadota bacterium]